MLPVILLAFFPQDATALLPDPHLPNRGNSDLDVQHYALHLRLDPIRQWIEREFFLKVAQNDLHQFGGANANTQDFENALAASTSQDIHTFFQVWGYANTIPRISRILESEKKDGNWQVHLQVKQENSLHLMAGEVAFLGNQGQQARQIFSFDSAEITLNIELPFSPTEVLFGPDRLLPWIPAS
jgi:hypothetical protein